MMTTTTNNKQINEVGLTGLLSPALRAIDRFFYVRRLRKLKRYYERNIPDYEKQIKELRAGIMRMQDEHMAVCAALRDAGVQA